MRSLIFVLACSACMSCVLGENQPDRHEKFVIDNLKNTDPLVALLFSVATSRVFENHMLAPVNAEQAVALRALYQSPRQTSMCRSCVVPLMLAKKKKKSKKNKNQIAASSNDQPIMATPPADDLPLMATPPTDSYQPASTQPGMFDAFGKLEDPAPSDLKFPEINREFWEKLIFGTTTNAIVLLVLLEIIVQSPLGQLVKPLYLQLTGSSE